jgi:hypothetical protein
MSFFERRWYEMKPHAMMLLARLLSGAATGFAAVALAQSPASLPTAPPAPPLPYQSPHKTEGAVTCASSLCHGSVRDWKGSNVLQNEYLTWSRLDRHAQAYNVLLNAKSKRIAANLGLKEPAHQAKLCLDCHAHNVPEGRRGERFQISENITCEACHGPAEKWLRSHVASDATHARSLADGLYPTNDAIARAKLCLSCHFGNQDKLVTHRIMGAGHPRMSFELDTFTQLAPSHFVIDEDYAARKQVWEGVKVWAIGQALAVEATLNILLDEQRGRDGVFPELVLFDCHACHRPMAENRLQLKTPLGTPAVPGLVRLNDSNLLMLRAIARALNPALGAQVSQQTIALHRAIAGEGDVREQAAQLTKLTKQLVSRIAVTNVDNTMLRGILNALVDDGINGAYRDYAAAEQAAMAISSVGRFMIKRGALPAGTRFNNQWQKLNATLANDEKFKPADFAARLREFKPLIAERSQ